MHFWHDVSCGDSPPLDINVIVEIPQDSKVKYELDKVSGLIKLDRVLYSPMHYPLNYGFVPQTYCDDKDPLDALVLTQYPLHPGTLVSVRPVGVITMIDDGEGDDKLIAVAKNDPQVSHINELNEISPHQIKEITHFFSTYKKLQGKEVEIKEILGREEALAIVETSIADYRKQKF